MAKDLAEDPEVQDDEQQILDKQEQSLLDKYVSATEESTKEPSPSTSDDQPASEEPARIEAADAQRLADLHGISVDEVSKFSSVQDAETAINLGFKSLVNEGLKYQAPPQPEPEKKAEEINWGEYDESDPVVTQFKKSQERIDTLESALTNLYQTQITQAQQQALGEAHKILDEMDLEPLGKTGDLSGLQGAVRDSIITQTKAMCDALYATQKPVPDMKTALSRAVHFELKESIDKKRQSQKSKAIEKRQSKKLGSPGRKPGDISSDPKDHDMTEAPELLDYFDELSRR